MSSSVAAVDSALGRDELQVMPVRTGPAHFSEYAALRVEQLVGRVEFEYLSVAEDKYTVVIQNGLESVGDCDYNGTCKDLPDGLLNLTKS